jgi:8-oxo-dGTP diphosphatase
MRDRSASTARASAARGAFTVDVVIITSRGRQLVVLGSRAPQARGREVLTLPWSALRAGDVLEDAARRVARTALGGEPAWLEQVGAFGDGARHPSGGSLSVCYAAVVAAGEHPRLRGEWLDGAAAGSLPDRQRRMVEAAFAAVRLRMDHAPIPFRLLPSLFTLSELQEVYEILLGRRLHKASFRRALHASWLVEPSDEWRSEGRGRPAQLFRYAPRRRRGHRRAVRFDQL